MRRPHVLSIAASRHVRLVCNWHATFTDMGKSLEFQNGRAESAVLLCSSPRGTTRPSPQMAAKAPCEDRICETCTSCGCTAPAATGLALAATEPIDIPRVVLCIDDGDNQILAPTLERQDTRIPSVVGTAPSDHRTILSCRHLIPAL